MILFTVFGGMFSCTISFSLFHEKMTFVVWSKDQVNPLIPCHPSPLKIDNNRVNLENEFCNTSHPDSPDPAA